MSKSIKIAKENEFKYIQMGLNIAHYRKLQGYTQEELAELVGISRSHISSIEAPNIVHSISLELLFNIAESLKVGPNRLLELQD